jgi:hypothetical protein
MREASALLEEPAVFTEINFAQQNALEERQMFKPFEIFNGLVSNFILGFYDIVIMLVSPAFLLCFSNRFLF